MRPYKQYTDKDIVTASKHVKSLAGLLRALKLKPAGGNYSNVKVHLQRLKIDTSHWTGQAWNKNAQLKDWANYNTATQLKPHLIRKRTHRCENCQNTKWLKKLIPLEVHHLDGDRTNNKLENLQLLCCNCHAMTKNYCVPTFLNAVVAKR